MGECGKLLLKETERNIRWAKIKKKESNRNEEKKERREERWSIRGKGGIVYTTRFFSYDKRYS